MDTYDVKSDWNFKGRVGQYFQPAVQQVCVTMKFKSGMIAVVRRDCGIILQKFKIVQIDLYQRPLSVRLHRWFLEGSSTFLNYVLPTWKHVCCSIIFHVPLRFLIKTTSISILIFRPTDNVLVWVRIPRSRRASAALENTVLRRATWTHLDSLSFRRLLERDLEVDSSRISAPGYDQRVEVQRKKSNWVVTFFLHIVVGGCTKVVLRFGTFLLHGDWSRTNKFDAKTFMVWRVIWYVRIFAGIKTSVMWFEPYEQRFVATSLCSGALEKQGAVPQV